MTSAVRRTRYALVKKILNTAAGDSTSDYGGAGRFWNSGVDALKAAKVYGVSMIAPESLSSCSCHSSEEGAKSAGKRGEASGLIKGLRGEAPFDGGRFPRLPWGGHRVAPDDIDFISRWIDDGCPADDQETTVDLGPLLAEPGAQRIQVADISEFSASADYVPRNGEPRHRMNIDCMTELQIDRLRDAFRKIYDLNRWPEDRRNYNNIALIHQNHCQHGWERFLPWHRAYLYELEQDVQDFLPGLTLPYWDWTMPQYQPEAPERGWIIPNAFKAYLTEPQVHTLIAELVPNPSSVQRDALLALARDRVGFTSQHAFFCHLVEQIGYTHVTPRPNDANRRRFIDALLASNALWYPLRYPAEYHVGGETITTAIHYHYPSTDDMAQILSLNNFRDFGGGSIYDAAFGFLDQNPHNTMHIWTGGQNPDAGAASYRRDSGPASTHETSARLEFLASRRNAAIRVNGRRFHAREDLFSQPDLGDMFSNLTASYDPIFWPIHVNVDRIWWEWQKCNPSSTPTDLEAVLSPWNYTVRDTLDISQFGYEYVRGSHFMPVGLEAPVGRFVSQPITIDEPTKAFRKAEIRLHGVPQLMRSCFVRAFLNDPGANATTPLRDNPHYAGYLAIFGHGACYGGPGHCDIPPRWPREYDRRTRSHDMLRTHRIDATVSAKAVLADTNQLRITLVVVGGDYREEPDILKLEGVSLSLLD